MKDLRGWVSFAVFVLTCCYIGVNRLLMRSLNNTVIAMLIVSVIIVTFLNWKKAGEQDSGQAGQ
jgi:Flp pilus assembly protein protease CpaA